MSVGQGAGDRAAAAAPGPRHLVRPLRLDLLRRVPGAHPRPHAPHELRLGRMEATCTKWFSQRATGALGPERGDPEHLPWDRVPHREPLGSGQDFVAGKTPADVCVHRRPKDGRPDARFVFPPRHPESAARSWPESDPVDAALRQGRRGRAALCLTAVEETRTADADGFAVRHEDITAAPEREMRRPCAFLGLGHGPAVPHHGGRSGAGLVRGLGGRRGNIRTGTVRPGRPLPGADRSPAPLRAMRTAWDDAS